MLNFYALSFLNFEVVIVIEVVIDIDF